MKTIIAALVLMTSTAFAQVPESDGPMIHPIMPRLAYTVVNINQIDSEIRSIDLNSNGDVIVTPRITRNLVIFKLSPTNKQELLSAARSAQSTELETLVYEIVCMMVANPNTRREVSIFNPETGKLRLVLSASGCMYSTRIFPKDEYHRNAVKELRSQLIVLARQKMNK